MNAPTQDFIKKYIAKKSFLRITPRDLAVFEYRNGITDGIVRTQKEAGKKFGISSTRARQIEAHVKDEMEKN